MKLQTVWCLLVVSLPAAYGQAAEAYISGGQAIFRNEALGVGQSGQPSLFYRFKDSSFRIGARLALNTKRFIGHEIGYAYSPSHVVLDTVPGDIKISSHQYFYNFLGYLISEGSTFRPFIAVGGHLNTFYPPGTSVSYGNGVTKVGFNYGAGFKIKAGSMFALRFDVRDYATMKPFDFPEKKGLLHQIEASAGFGIHF
ncbi:MAG: outer membrane beta-barrel protein [Candidatus Solibacter usitatus]|nr:outer membrane beta-barrel protein [Candidatus Solibacter usitatus]